MTILQHPSPNFDARRDDLSPDMVVLHYTGMQGGAEALARLSDPGTAVSAHYLVDEDGAVYQLVAEEKRAWHAGVSFWRGRDGINHFSIGIEIVNPGHEFGYRSFPDVQVDRVITLLEDIRARYSVPDAHLIGHSDIAPDRKTDPGELFPWARLAAHGHGVVPTGDVSSVTPFVTPGSGAGQITAVQEQLAAIGYKIDENGIYDAGMEQVVRAFQRRWRQSHVTGMLDQGTQSALSEVFGQLKA